jgi:hypothetical protein
VNKTMGLFFEELTTPKKNIFFSMAMHQRENKTKNTEN